MYADQQGSISVVGIGQDLLSPSTPTNDSAFGWRRFLERKVYEFGFPTTVIIVFGLSYVMHEIVEFGNFASVVGMTGGHNLACYGSFDESDMKLQLSRPPKLNRRWIG